MAFDWAAVVAAIVAGILGAIGGTFLGARLSLKQSKKERLYDLKLEYYRDLLDSLAEIGGVCISLSLLLQVRRNQKLPDYYAGISLALADLPPWSQGHERYRTFVAERKALTKKRLEGLHAELVLDSIFALRKGREGLEESLMPLALLELVKDDDVQLEPLTMLLKQRIEKNGLLLKHIGAGKPVGTFKHESPDFMPWVTAWNTEYAKYRQQLASDLGATLE